MGVGVVVIVGVLVGVMGVLVAVGVSASITRGEAGDTTTVGITLCEATCGTKQADKTKTNMPKNARLLLTPGVYHNICLGNSILNEREYPLPGA